MAESFNRVFFLVIPFNQIDAAKPKWITRDLINIPTIEF